MSEQIIVWQTGYVKGFKLIPYDSNLYSAVLGQYENKQVQFCIKEVEKKPSQKLHGYYRGCILPTAAQSETFRGWKLEEIHKYFTSKHLRDVIERNMNGTTVLIVTTMSTGDINSKRFTQYINDVRMELSSLGIATPDPIKPTIPNQ